MTPLADRWLQQMMLLQLCYLLHKTSASYYEYPNDDSQSEENNSDMDYSSRHDVHLHHHHSKNTITAPQFQIMPLSMPISQPQPNINQMQMPQMQIPQMQMPQIQMQQMQMPITKPQTQPMTQMQMPKMSMQQIPMTSMPQLSIPMSMSMMQVPSIRMPVQMTGTFPSPFVGQNLVYFPISSHLTSFFKNMILKPKLAEPVVTAIAILTTTRPTTTTTTSIRPPLSNTTEKGKRNFQSNPNADLSTRRHNTSLLESVLKKALTNFAKIIVETPEKTRNGNNRYLLTSLKKSKPNWLPKYGIVPIPDNMAHKLMAKMREMKEIRSRPKRLALFHSKFPIY